MACDDRPHTPTDAEQTIAAVLWGFAPDSTRLAEVTAKAFAGDRWTCLYSGFDQESMYEVASMVMGTLIRGRIPWEDSPCGLDYGTPMPEIIEHIKGRYVKAYAAAKAKYIKRYNEAEDKWAFAKQSKGSVVIKDADGLAGMLLDAVDLVSIDPWGDINTSQADWWLENMNQYLVFTVWHISYQAAMEQVHIEMTYWMDEGRGSEPAEAAHNAFNKAMKRLQAHLDKECK